MTKINQLIRRWPKGAIMTLSHIKTMGIERGLVRRYRKSGWIESVGYGAYKLAGDKVSWPGAVYGLQQKLNVHVGAKTALALKGFGHYLRASINVLFLFAQAKQPLPRWFVQNNWSVNLLYTRAVLFAKNNRRSRTELSFNDFSIPISVPERAILEMLYFVPSLQGFDEAMKIMETLTSLRPELVQQLLDACNSIKVKRLFLYMAEKQNHFWFEQLNPDKIYLGSGKRSIIKNGVFNKKYQITVPKEYEV